MNQEITEIPLFVSGTKSHEPLMTRSGIPVTLDRAELVFGPLYLCAGTTAGELCEVSRLEWLDSVVLDALDEEPRQVGELSGVTGAVRSWMYDLGISSQLTRGEPFMLDATQSLGGSSLVIEGHAQVEGIEVPFSASIAVKQTDETELGVPVVRKSLSDHFFREVTLDEEALTIHFNPADWVSQIDLASSIQHASCTSEASHAGRVHVACDGTLEYQCEGEVILEQRDCRELGQICLPQQGCADRLEITPDSEQYRAIKNALLSGVRPAFIWQ